MSAKDRGWDSARGRRKTRETRWMTVSSAAPPDAATLAAAVRQLAHRAHRVLNDPASGPDDARELARRAFALRCQLRGRSSASVARWLDRLQDRLANA